MDLNKALAAHADWKVKLRMALSEGRTLDADKIASDCQCEFGIWLKGEGRAIHGAQPAFLSCVESHAAFHRAAGAVARSINMKDYAGADRQMGPGTPFTEASKAVAVAVHRLKRELQAA